MKGGHWLHTVQLMFLRMICVISVLFHFSVKSAFLFCTLGRTVADLTEWSSTSNAAILSDCVHVVASSDGVQ